ncbi:MAG TPA: hypothetical protein VEL73_03855 [Mycobacteriales bacterium]|nr:hypothetical protein [Mycobacteriales bacterium]
MLLQTFPRIAGDAEEACWRLYTEAFDRLRTAAAQRHVMLRGEFEDVLRDERVTKYVAVDPAHDRRICGLATVTNDLCAVPLVSPDFFAHRWPALYARRRIWYVGFVAIHPDYQRGTLFAEIIADIGRMVAAAGGVAAMDVCRRTDEQLHLPRAVGRFLEFLVPGTRGVRLDEQTYWAYEFPATS